MAVITTSDISSIVASQFFNLLLPLTMYFTLILEVWVAVKDVRKIYGRMVYTMTALVACAGMGFTFATSSLVIDGYLHMKPIVLQEAWMTRADIGLRMAMIVWCTLVFAIRMGHNRSQLRKAGDKKFGIMDVFVIMGAGGLILPTSLVIAQFSSEAIAPLDACVTSSVVLILPLTNLWALHVQAEKQRKRSASNAAARAASLANINISTRTPRLSRSRHPSLDSDERRYNSAAASMTTPLNAQPRSGMNTEKGDMRLTTTHSADVITLSEMLNTPVCHEEDRCSFKECHANS